MIGAADAFFAGATKVVLALAEEVLALALTSGFVTFVTASL